MSGKREAQLREKIARLDADWQRRQTDLRRKWLAAAENYKELVIPPQKSRIRIVGFGIAWVPHWRLVYADGFAETFPAFARGSAS